MFNLTKSCKKGVTLVEIMMVVTISGIIFMGVFLLINNSNMFVGSIGNDLILTDNASEAMYIISKDFKNAKASTMGNLGQNPGFEEPMALTANPTAWDALNVNVSKVGFTGSNIKSGISSIKITEAASYNSNSFNIPANKNFILSGWSKKPGSMNIIRSSDNSDLIAPVSNANSTWTHLTATVNLGAPETAKFKLQIPVGTWAVCTVPGGKDVTDMCTYRNRLFIGTWEPGQCYSYEETTGVFEFSPSVGINPHVATMCVYDPDGPGALGEVLLVTGGMWDWGNAASWAYWGLFWHTGDVPNTNWNTGWPTGAGDYTQFGTDSGYGTGQHFLRSMYAHTNGRLYVGFHGWTNNSIYAEIRDYDPMRPSGSRWRVLPALSPWVNTNNMVISMCVFNPGSGDKLYFGTASGSATWHVPWGAGNVYGYDINSDTMLNGGAPLISSGAAIRDMKVFNGKIYAAANSFFESDGINPWQVVNTSPVVIANAISLCVYHNKLYVGTNSGNIYVYDGTTWANFTGIPLFTINELAVCNDTMYAGVSTNYWFGQNVYAWQNQGYFDDVAISPEEVIFDGTTVANGVDNVYRYYTCDGMSGNEYSRFKLYRLRYEPSLRRLYREYSLDGGTTWIPKGLKIDGSICDFVTRVRIFNHNQESFDFELKLEKVDGRGKTKKHETRSSYTPAIS